MVSAAEPIGGEPILLFLHPAYWYGRKRDPSALLRTRRRYERRTLQKPRTAHRDCLLESGQFGPPTGVLDREEETMASSPTPTSELTLIINKFRDEAIVQCGGRITADTTEKLRDAVKPLLAESKF